MALTIAEREHRRFAEILSRFGFTDTDDVPLSAVLESALQSLTSELTEWREARALPSPADDPLGTRAVREVIHD